jgi:hypothetical protein
MIITLIAVLHIKFAALHFLQLPCFYIWTPYQASLRYAYKVGRSYPAGIFLGHTLNLLKIYNWSWIIPVFMEGKILVPLPAVNSQTQDKITYNIP